MTPTILTFSGHYFDLMDPEHSEIRVTDIAHALSHICRFTGHTREAYSVAQHSIYVSHLVLPELALQALLHDAAEAYIGDVSSPLKALLPEYKLIEKRIEAAIFTRFGLPPQIDRLVKEADMVMLATERRDLMPQNRARWTCDEYQTTALPIVPLPAAEAKAQFIARFLALGGLPEWL
jgi:5'-deoxynucleotidase YfbR-like HD superfamily hydrolase